MYRSDVDGPHALDRWVVTGSGKVTRWFVPFVAGCFIVSWLWLSVHDVTGECGRIVLVGPRRRKTAAKGLREKGH